MRSREDLLALIGSFAAGQTKSTDQQTAQIKERLAKEHDEIMKLIKNEESISRELTKKTL